MEVRDSYWHRYINIDKLENNKQKFHRRFLADGNGVSIMLRRRWVGPTLSQPKMGNTDMILGLSSKAEI